MRGGTSGFGNYDRQPATPMPPEHVVEVGGGVWQRVRSEAGAGRPVVAIDCYPGVEVDELCAAARESWPDAWIIDVEQAARPIAEIDALLAPFLTDDRVFGVLAHVDLAEFYDQSALDLLARQVDSRTGPVVLVGWGAARVVERPDLLVLADLPRWEIQTRQRAGQPNWRCDNGGEDPLRKYKRSYFVEWRTADAHKRRIWPRLDFFLDTSDGLDQARLITADTLRAGLELTAHRPFRVVPYFDPGTWGGQWMREVCGLSPEPDNFAWCFDCVPEENALALEIGGVQVQMPAINLVFAHPVELLGARTHARFGPEFPIRFDLLDTMGGGNLSLQVHPLTGYIQDTFGMHYTQDESYYLLDAGEDAVVYLGLTDDAEPADMFAQLQTANEGGQAFPAERFVNTFPARRHDHFSIPAGTVHCSGANSMVLEISATPYIFTFKMWDWGRLGLDGLPRPINLEHAAPNIQWDRRTGWVRDNLVDQTTRVAQGEGWLEERTGLHELEFIECRRHWITGTCPHDTGGTVHVKNLVEGAEAVVESPTGAFEPFVVHYAETFIVPASVGAYTVRPHGGCERIATITASVRGTRLDDV